MRKSTSKIKPLAVIGPSGCGKSSVVQILTARGLIYVAPTWTDRPKRAGEEEFEHRFVSPAEMSKLAAGDKFLEVVQPFSLPFRYGLPVLKTIPGRVTVVMLRAPFVTMFLKYYPKALVYQVEADFAFAQQSVLARSPNGHGTRLTDFQAEISAGRRQANRTFHNHGEGIELLADAIEAAMIEDGLVEPKLHTF